MEHLINEQVIVAVAFVIFVVALFKPVKRAIINALDQQVAEAIKDLEEAAKMRLDAENMLKDAKSELDKAKQTALQIVENAQGKAENILANAEIEIEKISKKKSEVALARITQQERQIIEDFKNEAIDLALQHVQNSLIEELDQSAQMSLIEGSIKNIKKIVN